MQYVPILNFLFSAASRNDQIAFNQALAKWTKWTAEAIAAHTHLLVDIDVALAGMQYDISTLLQLAFWGLAVSCIWFMVLSVALALIERRINKNHLAVMNEFYFMRQLFVPPKPVA